MFKASKQNLIVDEDIDMKQRQNRAGLRVTGLKTTQEVNGAYLNVNEQVSNAAVVLTYVTFSSNVPSTYKTIKQISF